MLRRAIRRASRYLQTTVSVLAGAAQRHALSRSRARARRLSTRLAETAVDHLIATSVEKLTQRQSLMNNQQRSRKLQAVRLLETKHRFLCSMYRVKASLTHVRSYRSAKRLERKLLLRSARAADIIPATYRSSELLQRQTTRRISR